MYQNVIIWPASWHHNLFNKSTPDFLEGIQFQYIHKSYFQGMFYAIVICGLRVLRVSYGPLPIFLCNIAGFLNGCAILFAAITVTMYTFTRFMFVCIWKRMKQMDGNIIVRIATIQAISMSLLFTATWLQLQGQHRITVSFLCESA